MKNVEKNAVLYEVKKIAKEFNRKEQLIEIMLYKSKKEGYNTYESLQNIEEYFKKVTCPKVVQQYKKIQKNIG